MHLDEANQELTIEIKTRRTKCLISQQFKVEIDYKKSSNHKRMIELFQLKH